MNTGEIQISPIFHFNHRTVKYLAILNRIEGVAERDFGDYVKSEASKVWQLYQKEKILEIYFTEGDIKPVIILNATSLSEAKEILDSLPMIKNGLFTYDLLHLQAYNELAELFKIHGATIPSWWPNKLQ